MIYEFKESTEKVGLRIHPGKTKVLINRSSISPDSEKEIQIAVVKIEILTRSESVRYFGQLVAFQHQETTEIKKFYEDNLGDVPQVKAGADFKKTTCSNTVSDCSTQQ